MWQQVILSLLGYTGDVIVPVYDQDGVCVRFALAEEVEVVKSVRLVVDELVALGHDCMLIRRFCEWMAHDCDCTWFRVVPSADQQPSDAVVESHRSPGLYLRAVAAGLEDALQAYTRCVVAVEQGLLRKLATRQSVGDDVDPAVELFCIKTELTTAGFWYVVPALGRLVRSVMGSPLFLCQREFEPCGWLRSRERRRTRPAVVDLRWRGARVCDLLMYRVRVNRVPWVRTSLTRVLRRVLRVMRQQCASWLAHGLLVDPEADFFVALCRLRPLGTDRSRSASSACFVQPKESGVLSPPAGSSGFRGGEGGAGDSDESEEEEEEVVQMLPSMRVQWGGDQEQATHVDLKVPPANEWLGGAEVVGGLSTPAHREQKRDVSSSASADASSRVPGCVCVHDHTANKQSDSTNKDMQLQFDIVPSRLPRSLVSEEAARRILFVGRSVSMLQHRSLPRSLPSDFAFTFPQQADSVVLEESVTACATTVSTAIVRLLERCGVQRAMRHVQHFALLGHGEFWERFFREDVSGALFGSLPSVRAERDVNLGPWLSAAMGCDFSVQQRQQHLLHQRRSRAGGAVRGEVDFAQWVCRVDPLVLSWKDGFDGWTDPARTCTRAHSVWCRHAHRCQHCAGAENVSRRTLIRSRGHGTPAAPATQSRWQLSGSAFLTRGSVYMGTNGSAWLCPRVCLDDGFSCTVDVALPPVQPASRQSSHWVAFVVQNQSHELLGNASPPPRSSPSRAPAYPISLPGRSVAVLMQCTSRWRPEKAGRFTVSVTCQCSVLVSRPDEDGSGWSWTCLERAEPQVVVFRDSIAAHQMHRPLSFRAQIRYYHPTRVSQQTEDVLWDSLFAPAQEFSLHVQLGSEWVVHARDLDLGQAVQATGGCGWVGFVGQAVCVDAAVWRAVLPTAPVSQVPDPDASLLLCGDMRRLAVDPIPLAAFVKSAWHGALWATRLRMEWTQASPLGLWFTPAVLEAYHAAFRFLFSLTRVHHRVRQLFALMQHAQRTLDRHRLPAAPLLPLISLRARIQAVLDALVSYCQVDVLGPRLRVLQRMLRQCHDFQRLNQLHALFCAGLERAFFLRWPEVWRCVRRILAAADLFAIILRHVCQRIFAFVAASGRKGSWWAGRQRVEAGTQPLSSRQRQQQQHKSRRRALGTQSTSTSHTGDPSTQGDQSGPGAAQVRSAWSDLIMSCWQAAAPVSERYHRYLVQFHVHLTQLVEAGDGGGLQHRQAAERALGAHPPLASLLLRLDFNGFWGRLSGFLGGEAVEGADQDASQGEHGSPPHHNNALDAQTGPRSHDPTRCSAAAPSVTRHGSSTRSPVSASAAPASAAPASAAPASAGRPASSGSGAGGAWVERKAPDGRSGPSAPGRLARSHGPSPGDSTHISAATHDGQSPHHSTHRSPAYSQPTYSQPRSHGVSPREYVQRSSGNPVVGTSPYRQDETNGGARYLPGSSPRSNSGTPNRDGALRSDSTFGSSDVAYSGSGGRVLDGVVSNAYVAGGGVNTSAVNDPASHTLTGHSGTMTRDSVPLNHTSTYQPSPNSHTSPNNIDSSVDPRLANITQSTLPSTQYAGRPSHIVLSDEPEAPSSLYDSAYSGGGSAEHDSYDRGQVGHGSYDDAERMSFTGEQGESRSYDRQQDEHQHSFDDSGQAVYGGGGGGYGRERLPSSHSYAEGAVSTQQYPSQDPNPSPDRSPASQVTGSGSQLNDYSSDNAHHSLGQASGHPSRPEPQAGTPLHNASSHVDLEAYLVPGQRPVVETPPLPDTTDPDTLVALGQRPFQPSGGQLGPSRLGGTLRFSSDSPLLGPDTEPLPGQGTEPLPGQGTGQHARTLSQSYGDPSPVQYPQDGMGRVSEDGQAHAYQTDGRAGVYQTDDEAGVYQTGGQSGAYQAGAYQAEDTVYQDEFAHLSSALRTEDVDDWMR